MSAKAPQICEPTNSSAGRPATFIFLHGYGDDAEGLPLGLAQQFQFNGKLPYLRWVLPNAPHNPDAMTQAWYTPKALPNSMKPRIPGHEDDTATDPDDEAGILSSVARVDELVQAEIERGVSPSRVIVGGFSQGCAVSYIYGLTGRTRDSVGGIICLSGYLPLFERIPALRQEVVGEKRAKKWFVAHGTKDVLVPRSLFTLALDQLAQLAGEDEVEQHLYDGMSHSTAAPELRDMLRWFETVIPP